MVAATVPPIVATHDWATFSGAPVFAKCIGSSAPRIRKPSRDANTNNTAQEVKTEESEFKKGVSFANDAKSGDGKPKKQSRFKQQRLHQQLEQDITDVKPDPRFEKKLSSQLI